MSLIVSPFQFANCTSSLDAAAPSNPQGINFTAGANNVDAAAVGVLSALAHDVHYIVISATGLGISATATDALLDLLIDPAGGTSWSPLINDMLVGYTPIPSNAVPFGAHYHFPLWIPAGASIGVRCRTANTADITAGRVIVQAMGNPSRPDAWWCGQAVETLGVTAASSVGTSHTPGASGTYSSWASVGSATSARYGAVQFGTNGYGSITNGRTYFWQIGYGSNRLPGSPTFLEIANTTELNLRGSGFNQPLFCDIAAGTQMQVRGTCENTAQANNVAIYGVY